MNSTTIISQLKKMKGSRRWKTVARELGVSPATLSKVMHGTMKPGPAILNYLGLREVVKVSYQEIK